MNEPIAFALGCVWTYVFGWLVDTVRRALYRRRVARAVARQVNIDAPKVSVIMPAPACGRVDLNVPDSPELRLGSILHHLPRRPHGPADIN